MTDRYLSPEEIRDAAADLLPLLDEVLEHSATLDPMSIKVYQPGKTFTRLQRLVLRALRMKWGQRSVTEHAGYAFFDDRSAIHGVILVDKGSLWIATPYQPALRRSSDLYVKHRLLDYVHVCLADSVIATRSAALQNIDDARYAIERLLPEGHAMKRPERPTQGAKANRSSIERFESTP